MEDLLSEGLEERSELSPGTDRPRRSPVHRLEPSSTPSRSPCPPVEQGIEPTAELDPLAHGVGSGGPRTTRGRRRQGSPHAERAGYRRRAGQDMTRPLKTWMYENRGNPYPSKEEKTALALGSDMTLIQVSNWFANARRRLKNTVRQPGLSWSKRIQLYDLHACAEEDWAERRSVTSSASDHAGKADEADRATLGDPPAVQPFKGFDEGPTAPSTTANEEAPCPQFLPPPPVAEYQSRTAQHQQRFAFKQSILHRYLNDSLQHRGAAAYQPPPFRRHDPPQRHRVMERAPPPARTSDSGSLSSHDYEDVSCSPSDPEVAGHQPVFTDTSSDVTGRLRHLPVSAAIHGDVFYSANDAEETYWKEITAAIVLTNMALAKRQKALLQI